MSEEYRAKQAAKRKAAFAGIREHVERLYGDIDLDLNATAVRATLALAQAVMAAGELLAEEVDDLTCAVDAMAGQ